MIYRFKNELMKIYILWWLYINIMNYRCKDEKVNMMNNRFKDE